MDIVNQVDVGVIVVPAGDFIGVAVIVTTHLDDHQIGWLLCFYVPLLGVAVVDRVCPRAWV